MAASLRGTLQHIGAVVDDVALMTLVIPSIVVMTTVVPVVAARRVFALARLLGGGAAAVRVRAASTSEPPLGLRPVQEELRVLEESLWRAETRFDKRYMEEVLAPDFGEFGRSGRRYDRVTAMGMGSPGDRIGARLPLAGFEVHLVAENVGTYTSEVEYDEVQRAHRSSLWVRQQGRWRLRFHQGTPS